MLVVRGARGANEKSARGWGGRAALNQKEMAVRSKTLFLVFGKEKVSTPPFK